VSAAARALFSRPIAPLLAASALIGVGYGLMMVMVPVQGRLIGMPVAEIGLVATGGQVGYFIGCFIVPWMVARFGHVRLFPVFTLMAAAAPFLLSATTGTAAWSSARFLGAFAVSGTGLILESWLNSAAGNAIRGRVLGTQNLLGLTVTLMGQGALYLGNPEGPELFWLCAGLILLAIPPAATVHQLAPPRPRMGRIRILPLIRRAPAGVLASAAVGLVNAAFWSLGPVWIQDQGHGPKGVALFISATVLGGVLAQWPTGWLSDRMDRRQLLSVLALAGALISLALCLLPGEELGLILFLGLLFGAIAFPYYTVASAHAADSAGPDSYVETSAGLMVVYGAFGILGPLIAAWLMEHLGSRWLFLHAAITYGLVALLILVLPPLSRHSKPPTS